jgi:lipopolysaccharide transport system permease protein
MSVSIRLRPLVSRWTHWRDLLLVLVQRDMKQLYKNSVLGMLWSVIHPVMQLLIYVFLFQWVLSMDVARYSSFAFTGVLAYTWFSTALQEATGAIQNNADLITLPGFPVAILPVVTVITKWINFLIALPILLIVLWSEGVVFTANVLYLPVLFGGQFLFILAVAYAASAVNVYFRDLQHIVGVLLQLYFFITPIFYALTAVPEAYQWVYTINPMAHLVEGYRAILMNGAAPDLQALTILVGGAAVLLVGALLGFRRARLRFLEEL